MCINGTYDARSNLALIKRSRMIMPNSAAKTALIIPGIMKGTIPVKKAVGQSSPVLTLSHKTPKIRVTIAPNMFATIA